jgi:hypothetical protein
VARFSCTAVDVPDPLDRIREAMDEAEALRLAIEEIREAVWEPKRGLPDVGRSSNRYAPAFKAKVLSRNARPKRRTSLARISRPRARKLPRRRRLPSGRHAGRLSRSRAGPTFIWTSSLHIGQALGQTVPHDRGILAGCPPPRSS